MSKTDFGVRRRVDLHRIQKVVQVVKVATVPILSAPVSTEMEDRELLARVVDYYHDTLKAAKNGRPSSSQNTVKRFDRSTAVITPTLTHPISSTRSSTGLIRLTRTDPRLHSITAYVTTSPSPRTSAVSPAPARVHRQRIHRSHQARRRDQRRRLRSLLQPTPQRLSVVAGKHMPRLQAQAAEQRSPRSSLASQGDAAGASGDGHRYRSGIRPGTIVRFHSHRRRSTTRRVSRRL
jgi:hypothetical protein